jgi:predicted dehydrogenase
MKIGILSFAHMHAHSYAASLRSLPGVTLAGIADEEEQRGREAAATYQTTYYPRIAELLETDIDAVIVTSENARHCAMTLAAAKAGKHVLCEKPIAHARGDAEQMIAACERHGVILQMAFPCRFLTAVRRAKLAVETGALGKIRAINGTNHGRMPGGWFINRTLSGGGAVIDHTVHVVDLMRWFLGTNVARVYAQVDTRFNDIPIDDCGTLFMEFENGTFATLDPSWSRPRSFPTWGDVTMQLVGERGTLFIDALRQTVALYEDATMRHRLSFWGDGMDLDLVGDFVRCVRDGGTPSITGQDGLQALCVALAAYKSAAEHRFVRLDEV